jgi:hypothetical protein
MSHNCRQKRYFVRFAISEVVNRNSYFLIDKLYIGIMGDVELHSKNWAIIQLHIILKQCNCPLTMG